MLSFSTIARCHALDSGGGESCDAATIQAEMAACRCTDAEACLACIAGACATRQRFASECFLRRLRAGAFGMIGMPVNEEVA